MPQDPYIGFDIRGYAPGNGRITVGPLDAEVGEGGDDTFTFPPNV